MKINEIESFILVAEKQGFQAAASACGVSKAAISKRIKNLEDRLNTLLFERTTRQIKLTEIGQQYYNSCIESLNHLKDAENQILQASSEPTGKLHVLSHTSYAERYLLPFISEFKKQYPRIDLTLEIADKSINNKEEYIDIVFGASFQGPDNWIQKKLTSTRYHMCASPNYFKTNSKLKTPEDLKSHQYIQLLDRHPNNQIVFKNKQSILLKPHILLNNVNAMLKLALDGHGLIFMHTIVVEEFLENEQLIEVLQDYAPKPQNVYVYYKRKPYVDIKTKLFINFFYEKNNIPSI